MKNKKLVIFGALALAGAVATAVAATWAGYKTKEVIARKKPVGKMGTVKAVGKYYIPAGIALGITIISDVAVYRIGMMEIAALTGTVTYLTTNKKQLEQRVKDMVGEEKWNEIKNSLREEQAADEMLGKYGPVDIQDTGYGNTLCQFKCDYFDIWFRSDPTEVKIALDEFQHRWKNGEYLGFIPDLLDMLHIHLKPGMEMLFADWGWPNCNPDCKGGFGRGSKIHIDVDVVEGYAPGYPEETMIIELFTPPFECYMEY